MNALTLHQPWAWAIVSAVHATIEPKRIENRTWMAPKSAHGEPLAIHAGKTIDDEAIEDLLDLGFEVPDVLPIGAVVGVATLRFCSTWVPSDDHPQRVWYRGPVAWVLAEVGELPEPVPCRGQRRLWTLPGPVARDVLHALPHDVRAAA